jgi:uncharacterized membrane protein AbrB (regulator of aidB expression)
VLFIAVLGLGIAWNLAAIALQQWVVGSMVPPGAPADVRETIQVFLLVIRLVSALTAIGISVLFGWLIKRLASIEVKREFGAA